MLPLSNPMVLDLLELAEGLARQPGRANLKQAAARRAVSSAYYAVFHALCTVCTIALTGETRTDLAGRAYRSLDHATARKRLAGMASRPGSSAGVKRLSVGFGELQDQRQLADYGGPGTLFSDAAASIAIQTARDLVAIIEHLTRDESRELAVELLVAKPR